MYKKLYLKGSAYGAAAVGDARFLRVEVVGVAAAAAVGEELAPPEFFVEVEFGHVARADALVFVQGARV